ncbi:hypothetical protein WR25_25858 [Diploscapter pachys]|uniref:Uncharacterized protein n=1 Tax=Diploscapter pachys TaxID=2018661 RepID=A0A2A2M4B0_9BILA|nr:hypothetical protein WR25_25858 [Diploscapter pachys]
MPAHRMAEQRHRRVRLRPPRAPEMAEVLDPWRKARRMADVGIGAQPARPALPAPVERGHRPAVIVQPPHRLDEFLDDVGAPALHQDAPARGGMRPVEPAMAPAVGRHPFGQARPRRPVAAQRVGIGGYGSSPSWLRFGKPCRLPVIA